MDQIKIGKFIQEKRRELKVTQSELAEKLNITDRAISKWENGVCMPDSGIIPEFPPYLNVFWAMHSWSKKVLNNKYSI